MIKKIKGLKYPDEYFTKFFFKAKLHERNNLTYLEFGCGNGSNLMLPYSYDNNVIGIDYDCKLIENANFNFSLFDKKNNFNFYCNDMRKFVKDHEDIYADIFVLPSVIYYISKEDFIVFLDDVIKNNIIKTNIEFYIRVRSTKDYRYGVGEKLAKQRYKLPMNCITGENNAEIEFYTESEILNILINKLNLNNYKVFHLDNQNEHNGEIILNSDIVIWGTIN
jgi:hypothetical protein